MIDIFVLQVNRPRPAWREKFFKNLEGDAECRQKLSCRFLVFSEAHIHNAVYGFPRKQLLGNTVNKGLVGEKPVILEIIGVFANTSISGNPFFG